MTRIITALPPARRRLAFSGRCGGVTLAREQQFSRSMVPSPEARMTFRIIAMQWSCWCATRRTPIAGPALSYLASVRADRPGSRPRLRVGVLDNQEVVMSETPRAQHTARATTGRRRRRGAPREPYSWLGVGALTVGVGAALAAGSGVAYADTPHSAVASSTAAGPKMAVHQNRPSRQDDRACRGVPARPARPPPHQNPSRRRPPARRPGYSRFCPSRPSRRRLWRFFGPPRAPRQPRRR